MIGHFVIFNLIWTSACCGLLLWDELWWCLLRWIRCRIVSNLLLINLDVCLGSISLSGLFLCFVEVSHDRWRFLLSKTSIRIFLCQLKVSSLISEVIFITKRFHINENVLCYDFTFLLIHSRLGYLFEVLDCICERTDILRSAEAGDERRLGYDSRRSWSVHALFILQFFLMLIKLLDNVLLIFSLDKSPRSGWYTLISFFFYHI